MPKVYKFLHARDLGVVLNDGTGWLHGCLGLHFLLNRRPLDRKLRYVLFALW